MWVGTGGFVSVYHVFHEVLPGDGGARPSQMAVKNPKGILHHGFYMKCLGIIPLGLEWDQLWWKGILLGWMFLVGAGLWKPRTGRWVCVVVGGCGCGMGSSSLGFVACKKKSPKILVLQMPQEDLRLPNVRPILSKFYLLQKTFTFLA